MPDGLNPSPPEVRFRHFERFLADGGAGGKDNKKAKFSPDRVYAPTDSISPIDCRASAPTAKKARAKESSQHFGVRFRPDLQKWVAEIRVFEWKSVDKKVWLGTFDSEEGAARAVDAARKLLQCQKKRQPNFPCAALAAYSESIPAHLQLTNITEEGMFKEVTAFVKRKAQEYAAGLGKSKGETAVGLREQLGAPQYQIQVGDVNGSCFPLAPDMELFTGQEDDASPTTAYSHASDHGTTAESHTRSSGTHLPSCDGSMMLQYPWLGSPTSVTYSSGPSSCSSAGTSPEDASWVEVLQQTHDGGMWTPPLTWTNSPEENPAGGYCLVAPASREDHVHPMDVSFVGMDAQSTIEVDDDGEYGLFSMEEDMEDVGHPPLCVVGDQGMVDPMMANFFLGEQAQVEAQVMFVDNQCNGWTFQQSFNPFSYNSFSNSYVFENRELC